MIKCKECDSTNIEVNFGSVCISNPPKYRYKCQDCGKLGFVKCDDVNRSDFNLNGVQEIKETPNTPPKEENKGRCLMCHAHIRVNPKDKSQPICTEHNCPCKWNERLIIKEEII